MTAGKPLTVRRWKREAPRHSRPDPSDCVHYWLLAEPNGPEVLGACKRCGVERSFPTTIPDLDFVGAGEP